MPTITRARALGAASALGIALPFAHPLAAAPKGDPGDAQILNAALAVERAAIEAYTSVVALRAVSPAVQAVFKQFLADHSAHLDALGAAVTQAGGTPSAELAALPPPASTPSTEREIIAFALTLERQASNSCLGTLAQFKNRTLATTLGSILGVETTHVALLAEALRQPAYPSSFITP